MDIVSVVVTVCQRLDIGLCDSWLFGELVLQHMHRFIQRTFEQPTNQPQCEHILTTERRLVIRPNSARPSFTIVEIGAATTCTPPSPSSRNGSSVVNCALFKSLFWNESVSIKTIALGFRFFTFTFSAAGFIATSTSALSPGVKFYGIPDEPGNLIHH